MSSDIDAAGSNGSDGRDGPDGELVRRLTTMLQAKAEQVTVTESAFDLPSSASFDVDVDLEVGGAEPGDPGAPSRGRVVVALAAALVLVAGLVGAAVVVVRSSPDEPAVTAEGGRAPRTTIADEPAVASVDLPSATLELRRADGARVLCLRPAGGAADDLRCGTGLRVNLVVGDTWYVAVAQQATGGPAPAPLFASGWGDPPFTGDPGMLPIEDMALPTESGSDHSWAFTLVLPPADAEFVWLQQGFDHTKIERPG